MLLRAFRAKPFFLQLRNSQVAAKSPRITNPFGWECTTREEFVRAWPKVAAKQDHHIRMIKDHHLPVHRSCPNDDYRNMIIYVYAGACLLVSVGSILSFAK